jgi:hypothetical protein
VLRALFGTKLNAALTMVMLLAVLTVPPFLNWRWRTPPGTG